MVSADQATGYVLAGGRATRMGRDKRLFTVQGRTLLQRAGDLLEEVLGAPPFAVLYLLRYSLIGAKPAVSARIVARAMRTMSRSPSPAARSAPTTCGRLARTFLPGAS